MKCPVCKTVDLKMSDRQGVEIDYCPDCRGVWLDRGELDKIIERADGGDSGSRERDHDRDKYYKDDKYYKHKRKKSLLSELFD